MNKLDMIRQNAPAIRRDIASKNIGLNKLAQRSDPNKEEERDEPFDWSKILPIALLGLGGFAALRGAKNAFFPGGINSAKNQQMLSSLVDQARATGPAVGPYLSAPQAISNMQGWAGDSRIKRFLTAIFSPEAARRNALINNPQVSNMLLGALQSSNATSAGENLRTQLANTLSGQLLQNPNTIPSPGLLSAIQNVIGYRR